MNKCLQSFTFNIIELNSLATLVIQSLLMESSKQLTKMLFANLKLLVSKYPKETNDFIEYISVKVPTIRDWLYAGTIESFEGFEFYASKSFESINNDYYKIIYKPTTYEEIDAFYNKKMQNMTKVLAILMTHSA